MPNKYLTDISNNVDLSLNAIIMDGAIYKTYCQDYCYLNTKLTLFVMKLVNHYRSQLVISKFINKHVIYLILLDYKTSTKQILCKIGYTKNFNERDSSLCTEYKCNNKLVCIREVNDVTDEQNLHDTIQKNYPNLVFNIQLKKISKQEIYIMHPKIIDEFYGANIQLRNQLYIEKEKTKQMKERTKQLLIIEKIIANGYSIKDINSMFKLL